MADDHKLTKLAAIDDPLDPSDLKDEVGLCLSGGGFKAAMYHLGALARINELGALRKIDRISSVSGGSIASGTLAAKWKLLTFDAKGVATNFRTEVFDPLVKFCREAEVDVAAWFEGVLAPSKTAADQVAESYAKWLVGKTTLFSLPAEKKGVCPRFVFNSTNVQLNSLVRFSNVGVRDWRVGEWRDTKLTLARVMAASSAFPPVLSPMVMTPPADLKPYDDGDRGYPPYTERLELADGGIYDNLGIETVWKRCNTILVSNAGDPFKEMGDPPNDWIQQLRRTVSMVHRQAENNRMRLLIALAKMDLRTVALWNLRGSVPAPGLALPKKEADLARNVDVRLRRLREDEATALLRHGYSMANASIKAFWLPDEPVSAAFPAYLKG